jgi:hypothetical protein
VTILGDAAAGGKKTCPSPVIDPECITDPRMIWIKVAQGEVSPWYLEEVAKLEAEGCPKDECESLRRPQVWKYWDDATKSYKIRELADPLERAMHNTCLLPDSLKDADDGSQWLPGLLARQNDAIYIGYLVVDCDAGLLHIIERELAAHVGGVPGRPDLRKPVYDASTWHDDASDIVIRLHDLQPKQPEDFAWQGILMTHERAYIGRKLSIEEIFERAEDCPVWFLHVCWDCGHAAEDVRHKLTIIAPDWQKGAEFAEQALKRIGAHDYVWRPGRDSQQVRVPVEALKSGDALRERLRGRAISSLEMPEWCKRFCPDHDGEFEPWTRTELLDSARQYNQTYGNPPLPDKEVVKAVDQAILCWDLRQRPSSSREVIKIGDAVQVHPGPPSKTPSKIILPYVVTTSDREESKYEVTSTTSSKKDAAKVLARYLGWEPEDCNNLVSHLLSCAEFQCDIQEQFAKDQRKKEAEAKAAADTRPVIEITTDEHLVNDAAVYALKNDAAVFQRAGVGLVHVVRDADPVDDMTCLEDCPRIVPMPLALVRERLAANAQFVSARWKDGEQTTVPEHPPDFCVKAVAARGQWKGIRRLTAVVQSPVLRPDGTILSEPGYDRKTGLIYEANCHVPVIPTNPSAQSIQEARDLLLDVVCDFPFEKPVYKSVWLSALLTPLARHAFKDPAPLFLVDSNTPGSGKGLLLDTTGQITTGRELPRMPFCGNEDEQRKKITAIAIAGFSVVLLDNLEELGGEALDAALTSTSWRDRILGRSEMVTMPLHTTWIATGNNVTIVGDTYRRIAHVRLESKLENPEERKGFKRPKLLEYVHRERGRLLTAALTILRGYWAAGKPDQKLKAWGSFDGWSDLVRGAVVWCGMEDPGTARKELRSKADRDHGALQAIFAGLEYLDAGHVGMTVSEIIHELNSGVNYSNRKVMAFRDAILAVCLNRGSGLDFPSSRSIGMKLHHLQGRVVGGKYLDRGERDHVAIWTVNTVECDGD